MTFAVLKTLRSNVKYLTRGFYRPQHTTMFRRVSSSPNFGICFDIDGVLARGSVPFQEATQAFSLLKENGRLQIPVAFVTNGMATQLTKRDQLQSWLHTSLDEEQVVMCQTPLQCYRDYKELHCLVVGQGPLKQIAADFGFMNVCMVDEVSAAYPLLDVALFDKRNKVSHVKQQVDTNFPRIDAILLLGEPAHWETPLQLIIDLLLTHGKPNSASARAHRQTLPIIACNKDFQYMHRAVHPRFANGTFLLCLESIFKKLVGTELTYSALIGKPSECTQRFAEHVLAKQALKMGIQSDLHTMYMVGDNVNSDIAAANLYQRYINSIHQPQTTSSAIPESRQLPANYPLLPQTVSSSKGVLVRTGVYRDSAEITDHRHRDFDDVAGVHEPTVIVDTVLDAVKFILEEEEYRNFPDIKRPRL